MWYVDAMGEIKCPPLQHCSMYQGGVVEAAQAGRGGDTGKHRTGFPGVWTPTYLGVIIQVSWPSSDGLGLWLYRGGGKPRKSQKK